MSLWRQLTRGLRVLTNLAAADRDVADEVQHLNAHGWHRHARCCRLLEFGQPRGEAALPGSAQLEGIKAKLLGVLPPLECGGTAQVLLLGGQTYGMPHAAA